MAGRPWAEEEIAILRDVYPHSGVKACERLLGGRNRNGIEKKAGELGLKREWTPPDIPTANRPLEELLKSRAEEFSRKQAHHAAKRNIEISRDDGLPYALLAIGDPHVDDPGSDIEYLAWCLTHAARQPGVMPINIGDLTNNWVGSLQRLYAHQTATDDEAVDLMRWMLTACPWAWVILGNHDKWGPVATMLCQEYEIPYVSHGGMFKIASVGGKTLTVDCRHTHRGNSQYNPSHGQIKQAYRGSRADIIIGGHTHTGAHTLLRNGVADTVAHAVRIGAFKRYDEYADALGFPDESLGPAVLFVIDPMSPHQVGWIQPFYDVEAGLDYLAWRREKA